MTSACHAQLIDRETGQAGSDIATQDASSRDMQI
jgi:hypothetical protein